MIFLIQWNPSIVLPTFFPKSCTKPFKTALIVSAHFVYYALVGLPMLLHPLKNSANSFYYYRFI